VQQEIRINNLTKAQVALKLASHWKAAQERVPTKLIDDKIENFIRRVTFRKVSIIAFTARPPHIADLTYNQLAKHNIFMSQVPGFSFNVSYKNQIFPDVNWCKANMKACKGGVKKEYHHSPAIFYKGIIFAHDINTKGSVFLDFFRQYKAYAKSLGLKEPTKVILIDDKMYNLLSVQDLAKKIGIDFYGYHIASNFILDTDQASKEKKLLYKQ
jgi:hypothetical protein